jgi:hypothetical protein
VREVGPFMEQYHTGVFAYRILARDLLLWINDLFFDGERLYLARSIVNAGSLLIFNLVFLGLLRRYGVAPGLWLIAILLVDLLAGLTLSVRSNPYTLPSVMLIYAGILAIESGRMATAVVVAAIASFTHEISALIPAFAVLHAVFGPGGLRGRVGWLGALCAVWLAIYIGLRVMIPTEAAAGGLFHSVTMSLNFEIHAVVVVLFVSALFVGLFPREVCVRLAALGRRDLLLFAALVVPYGIYMFFVGLLAELRLFLQFMPALVLGALLVWGRAQGTADDGRAGSGPASG